MESTTPRTRPDHWQPTEQPQDGTPTLLQITPPDGLSKYHPLAQFGATLSHIDRMASFGNARSLQLLKELIKRNITVIDHPHLPAVLLRAATAATRKLDFGLRTWVYAVRNGIRCHLANNELLSSFCTKLAACAHETGLRAGDARDLADFLRDRRVSVSHRDELTSTLFSHLAKSGPKAVHNHFNLLVADGDLTPVAHYVEGAVRHFLTKGSLWAALHLFHRSLSLHPNPMSSETLKQLYLELHQAIENSPRPYLLRSAYALSVGQSLVASDQNDLAEIWLSFALKHKPQFPSESQEVVTSVVCQVTWGKLDADDYDHLLRNALAKGFVTAEGIAKADPDLMFELAETSTNKRPKILACDWLLCDNFGNLTKQRNSRFSHIVNRMIEEEDYEATMKALTSFQGPTGVTSPLWEALAKKIDSTDPEFLSARLKTLQNIEVIDLGRWAKVISEACEKPELLNQVYTLLNTKGCTIEDKQKLADLWLILLPKMYEAKAPELYEMAILPHAEVAGGLFPTFETMPERQALFFHHLIAGAATHAVESKKALGPIVTSRYSLGPLFQNFALIEFRLCFDLELGHILLTTDDPDAFVIGCASVLDALSKARFLMSPSDQVMEHWDTVMAPRYNLPNTPTFIPTRPDLATLATAAPSCKMLLEGAAMIGTLRYASTRIVDMKPKLRKSDDIDWLTGIWSWAQDSFMPDDLIMSMGLNLIEAGITAHLPSLAEWLHARIEKNDVDHPLSSDVTDRLHSVLEHLAQHTDDEQDKIGKFLQSPALATFVTPETLQALWEKHLVQMLDHSTRPSVLISKVESAARGVAKTPLLTLEAPSRSESNTLIEASLSALARLAHLASGTGPFEQARKAFFDGLPAKYYRGAEHGNSRDQNTDYSLYLAFVDRLLRHFSPDMSARTAGRRVAWKALEHAIRLIPMSQREARQTTKSLARTYIDVTCKHPTLFTKEETPGALWKQIERKRLFEDEETKGVRECLLATGEMPKNSRYADAALVSAYCDAIRYAMDLDTTNSLAMAFHLTGKMDALADSKKHLHLMKPLLAPLLVQNTKYPMATSSNVLTLGMLLYLGQKWLADAPIEERKRFHEDVVSAIGETWKGHPFLELSVQTRPGGAPIIRRGPASWVLSVAEALFDALKSGVESGVYAGTPIQLLEHMEQSMSFFVELHKSGFKKLYIMDLMKLTAKLPPSPELGLKKTEVLKAWIDAIK